MADALIQLSMGIVAHILDNKKELVRDGHRSTRFGIWLVESTKGGAMVHNGA